MSAALDEVLDPREWFPSRLVFRDAADGGRDLFSSIVVAQKRGGENGDATWRLGDGAYVTMRSMMARQHRIEIVLRDREAQLAEVEGRSARAASEQKQLAAALARANPIKNRLRRLLGRS